ncbi:isochorismatase family protein [Streptomyces sp. NPDC006283]|uniref:isochorismatase family protein n=1 Tax=Streptomyces sp. NPDC006283 TaxID=3156741 RepID=UPI0033B8606F
MTKIEAARTALVLIDLMDRIVALPLEPRSGGQVVDHAGRLADAFRAAGGTVVLVRVERPGVAEQPPGSGLVDGLTKEGDLVVVKRTIGAFQGTGLHEQLQERSVTTLVLGGIATNLGVESTARAAADQGYDLFFAEDAMTAFTAEEHKAAITLNFPRIGEVVDTATVVDHLERSAGGHQGGI